MSDFRPDHKFVYTPKQTDNQATTKETLNLKWSSVLHWGMHFPLYNLQQNENMSHSAKFSIYETCNKP
jgi:hypothetical protein